MENGGRNNSSEERGNSTSADFGGNAVGDGGGIRTNDESLRGKSIGDDGSKIGIEPGVRPDKHSKPNDNGVEITAGYYFTPNGRIERIPDGHYIGSDGRLRKRRKQRSDSSNADGNARTDRSETGGSESEFPSEFDFREKPLKVRGKGGRKKSVKAETSKQTMVTMIASGCAALFTSIALLTKHDHWNLEPIEGKHLAEALNDAFDTLPEKQYAQVTAIIEKWIPWINLTFVAGAIIVPRLEASGNAVKETHKGKSERSNERHTTSQDNPFSNWSSLGYGQ